MHESDAPNMMHVNNVGVDDEEEELHVEGEEDTNPVAEEDDSLLFEFDQRGNPAVSVPP